MHHFELEPHQKIYIASDFHLGYPKGSGSREREHKILRWLEMVRKDASLIILLGDIFDFWYEYKKVVPKGFVRLQGKIAELTDAGIPIVFFTGNHDLWMFGVRVFHEPQSVIWNNQNILLGHGDGLGNGDYSYKFLKKALFTNPVCRFFFEWLHPNIGVGLAHFWSNSRKPKNPDEFIIEEYKGKEKEWIWQYCNEIHQHNPHHYYVFGHRHLPLCITMDTKTIASKNEFGSYYLNTGEWMNHFTYLEFGMQTTTNQFAFACKTFEAKTKWIVD